MRLLTEPYLTQRARWPPHGRHVLAQFDDQSVVVYQAYRPAIGQFAVTHQHFGGEFSFGRMSWIKPNFLWMMYRSGWGTKEGQQVTLAIWVQRAAFDALLAEAVLSHFSAHLYPNEEEWKRAVHGSEVRLQWDPDHSPAGVPLQRRALQLGLRGEALTRYGREWILEIQDISDFVAAQRQLADDHTARALVTPREVIFPVADPTVAARIALSPAEPR